MTSLCRRSIIFTADRKRVKSHAICRRTGARRDQAGAQYFDLRDDCSTKGTHPAERLRGCRDFAERTARGEDWCMMTADDSHDRFAEDESRTKVCSLLAP